MTSPATIPAADAGIYPAEPAPVRRATSAPSGLRPGLVVAPSAAPESAPGEATSAVRREVHATGHEWEWQLHGACRDIEPAEAELFFHPWGERDPSRSRRDRAAKAICATCPVARQCRDYALATREPYGVWGGLSEHDREEILGVRFG